MFSFALGPGRQIQELSTLPLDISTVVAERLAIEYAIDVRVDPPNDLVSGDRKIAGVLCQSHLRGAEVDWVVCGIGLNTNLKLTDATIPGSTSIFIETGQMVCHKELLGKLLKSLAPFARR